MGAGGRRPSVQLASWRGRRAPWERGCRRCRGGRIAIRWRVETRTPPATPGTESGPERRLSRAPRSHVTTTRWPRSPPRRRRRPTASSWSGWRRCASTPGRSGGLRLSTTMTRNATTERGCGRTSRTGGGTLPTPVRMSPLRCATSSTPAFRIARRTGRHECSASLPGAPRRTVALPSRTDSGGQPPLARPARFGVQ